MLCRGAQEVLWPWVASWNEWQRGNSWNQEKSINQPFCKFNLEWKEGLWHSLEKVQECFKANLKAEGFSPSRGSINVLSHSGSRIILLADNTIIQLLKELCPSAFNHVKQPSWFQCNITQIFFFLQKRACYISCRALSTQFS